MHEVVAGPQAGVDVVPADEAELGQHEQPQQPRPTLLANADAPAVATLNVDLNLDLLVDMLNMT